MKQWGKAWIREGEGPTTPIIVTTYGKRHSKTPKWCYVLGDP